MCMCVWCVYVHLCMHLKARRECQCPPLSLLTYFEAESLSKPTETFVVSSRLETKEHQQYCVLPPSGHTWGSQLVI